MLTRIFRFLENFTKKSDDVFKISPNDVFLVSYPRSGNTWMRYLLAHLFYPESNWDISNIGNVIPDIHQKFPDEHKPLFPRIFKSHEAYTSDYVKVIYIFRDGRDVAVSYFDFMKKLENYEGDFSVFLSDFLSGYFPYGSWHQHVHSWLLNNHGVELLAIKYTNLYHNPGAELLRVKDFLKTSWQDEEILKAIDNSSIDKFRKDYKTLKFESHWQKGFQGGVKGGPGKWKEVFSEEQNDIFWSAAGSVMHELGFQKEE